MPPAPSSTRRGSQEDLDGVSPRAHRASCAECRRLKVRCDRSVPCGSCLRRGCGNICPNGTLVTGQGHRAFWNSTQELRQKLSELANRVRELEDALSTYAGDDHRLLREELRKMKDPFLTEQPTSFSYTSTAATSPASSAESRSGSLHPHDDVAVVDVVGSLTVADDGAIEYIGHEAKLWWFMHTKGMPTPAIKPNLTVANTGLPAPLLASAEAFPLSLALADKSGNDDAAHRAHALSTIHSNLPPAREASVLCNVFYDHLGWFLSAVPSDEFDARIFVPIYGVAPGSSGAFDPRAPSAHAQLATLLSVLAIGSVMDPRVDSAEAHAVGERYFRLACAAILSGRTLDRPTLDGLEALCIMNKFLCFTDLDPRVTTFGWVLNGMVVKMAQAMGLHHDPSKFKNVNPAEADRRRRLFGELYAIDVITALHLTRPPSFSHSHTDVKFSRPEKLPYSEAFYAEKYLFMNEVLSVVEDEAFGTSPPTHATVMKLDALIRTRPTPPALQLLSSPPPEASKSDIAFWGTPQATCQRHATQIIKDGVTMILHRAYFSKALSDAPQDPVSSPFGASVTAEYQSAINAIKIIQSLHDQMGKTVERVWFVWKVLFTAAVTLGTLANQSPSIDLAPSALSHVDIALDLFSRVRSASGQNAVSVIRRVRDDARSQLARFRTENALDDASTYSSPQMGTSSPVPIKRRDPYFSAASTALLSFDASPPYRGGYADAINSAPVPAPTTQYEVSDVDISTLLQGMPAPAPYTWDPTQVRQQAPLYFGDWNFSQNNW